MLNKKQYTFRQKNEFEILCNINFFQFTNSLNYDCYYYAGKIKKSCQLTASNKELHNKLTFLLPFDGYSKTHNSYGKFIESHNKVASLIHHRHIEQLTSTHLKNVLSGICISIDVADLLLVAKNLGEALLNKLENNNDILNLPLTSNILATSTKLSKSITNFDSIDDLLLEWQSLDLLQQIITIDQINIEQNVNYKKIELIRELILKDLCNPPSIAYLAKESGLNSCYLKKWFKQRYNVTIYQYYLENRMLLAWELISTGKMNISETAIYVGYSSFSNFAIAFKKQFNILPSKVKRNLMLPVAYPSTKS